MKRRVPSALYGDYEAQLVLFTNVLPNGCWEFTGYILPTGYGQLGRNIGAHRVAWEVANGRPVPDGLVVDHQCHNLDPDCFDNDECAHRRCVNPDHLEAVPSGVNVLRGKGFAALNAAVDQCPEGHKYTEANTYYRPDRPGRLCRLCRRESNRRKYAARSRAPLDPLTPAIRAWAVAAGLPIADRGAIPRHIREAYLQAQPRAA